MSLDYTNCTGCHACVSKCPMNCISMQADELGFLYPCIDNTKCIGCNVCETVCAKVKILPDCSSVREIYAAKNKNNNNFHKFTSLYY